MACSWSAFALSIILLLFYAYHSWKATVGWEEVYVCIVERAWHGVRSLKTCTADQQDLADLYSLQLSRSSWRSSQRSTAQQLSRKSTESTLRG
jgi:hypothetical protein